MESRYVIDSVGLINYFNTFFDEREMLSKEARHIIDLVFNKASYSHRLIIPSIVFVEIFRKFLVSEEIGTKFFYEIYKPILENEYIEIKPFEQEVIEVFRVLNEFPMELHDRIVFASAIQLNSILITKDPVIINYNSKRKLLDKILF